MRSKNILSIVAFIAAFGLSAAFASLFISKNSTVGYNSTSYCQFKRKTPTATAISILIAADYNNARVRDRKIYAISETAALSSNSVAFADYARATEEYVDDSSSISQNNLPDDFKRAWREHLRAWRDSSNFLNKAADISSRSSMTAEEFDEADNFYGQEINRTFEKVLEIGNRYDADVR